jgi:hypothetical protein
MHKAGNVLDKLGPPANDEPDRIGLSTFATVRLRRRQQAGQAAREVA